MKLRGNEKRREREREREREMVLGSDRVNMKKDFEKRLMLLRPHGNISRKRTRCW